MAKDQSNLRLKEHAGASKRHQKARTVARATKSLHALVQKGHALARRGSANELTKMCPDAKKRLLAAILNPRLHSDKGPIKRQPGRLANQG